MTNWLKRIIARCERVKRDTQARLRLVEPPQKQTESIAPKSTWTDAQWDRLNRVAMAQPPSEEASQ